MTFATNVPIPIEMLQDINRQLKELKLKNRKIDKIVKHMSFPKKNKLRITKIQ